jgi:hypothetical protein
MYLIIYQCFYTCFIYVQYLPEDDQDWSKRVGVITNSVQNISLTFVLLLLLFCEVTINFFQWHFILWQRFYVISKCRDENYDDSDSDDGLVMWFYSQGVNHILIFFPDTCRT